MSKPIDQEREAFELAYSCAVANGLESTEELARYMWGQARAAVQPAGVTVPEGWKLVPIEPTDEMTWVSPLESSPETLRNLWGTMLAAAPHPVSGEQKPAGYQIEAFDQSGTVRRQQYSDRPFNSALNDALEWKGNFEVRSVPLYAAPPAAQDVSGVGYQAAAHLDEEVARLISLAVPRLREHGSHSLAVMLEAAVNAHRAQAQGGDV